MDDYIDQVYCRDDSVVRVDNKNCAQIQIKIVTGREDSHILSYNVETEREISWMASTRDCDLFYDQSGECMVLDSENGITGLNTKFSLFEYHVADRNEGCLDL